MEVITENPIIYIGANDTYEAEIFLYGNGDAEKPKDAKDKSVDDILKEKVTEDDILKEKVTDLGSFVVKGKKKEPTPAQKEEAKKRGLTWDSANKVFKKAEELGILDSILGKLGITPRTSTPPVGVDAPLGSLPPDVEGDKKGMSTTTKVLIGVGALAVIGLILYMSSNKTKNK